MNHSRLNPGILQRGDIVGIVSPAGPVVPERLEAGLEVLRSWGLEPRVYPHALGREGYLAGSDSQRLDDLNAALADPEVRAVLCSRGGYGVQRILAGVDYGAVRRDPKLVMGFSDITALHGALWRHSGLPTIHGPVVGQFGQGGALANAARQALMSPEPTLLKADSRESTFAVRQPGRNGARAEGTLLGGNLTMLASSLGTPWQVDFSGAILLLEDVGEAPYRIDRVLTQLRNSGALEPIVGIALGQFTGVRDDKYAANLEQVLLDRLGDLGVPLLGGLPVGHGDTNIALALGTHAVLDAASGTLAVNAVTA